MSTAAYRWNRLMTTSSVVVAAPSQPRKRLTAPSSSSMNSPAFLSASSLTSGSTGACAWPSLSVTSSARLLDLHAVLFEVLLRAWMKRHRRAHGLILQIDVLGLLVHRDQ